MSSPAPESCPSGKVTYPTSAAARRAIAGMLRKGRRTPAAAEPYRCDECGDWHLWSPQGVRPSYRRGRRR